MPRPLYLAQIGIGIAAIVWGRWACRYRQYRRPMYDRQLAQFLWGWFTRLPWGPARGVLTVAVIGLEPWYWGLVHDPRSYLIQAVNATAALTATALLVTTIAVRRVFSHEWVIPTYEAMLELVGDKYEGRPSSRVHLTRRWQWHRKGIWLSFPLSLRLKETHREDIRTTAEKVLGLRDVDYKWNVVGGYSHLIFRPAQVVPKLAPFRNPDIRRAIEGRLVDNPVAPVVGLGRGDVAVTINLLHHPHILISAGTIGGKSSTIANLVAQLLKANPDAIGVVLDDKEYSQRGLADVPGVVIAREPQEINAALEAVWTEIKRRNHECRDIPHNQPLPYFPRIILAVEEMNTTYANLNAWWRQQHGTRNGLAPGIYALDKILSQGRAARCHVIVNGQDMNNRILSGAGAGTVNIAARLLAEYDENTWRRLAHGAEWIPPVSHDEQPGWAILIHGRRVQELQRILMTDSELYQWLCERETENPPWLRAAIAPAPEGAGASAPGISVPDPRELSTLAIGPGSVPAETDGEVDYVTLREVAADTGDGTVPMRLAALKKASQRPGFPPVAIPHAGNGGNEYSKRKLVEFAATRRGDPGVYVMRPPGSKTVKIGESKTLELRRRQFAMSSKRLLKWVPCRSKLAAQRLEKAKHTEFDAYHVELEWFWYCGPVAAWCGEPDVRCGECPQCVRERVAV